MPFLCSCCATASQLVPSPLLPTPPPACHPACTCAATLSHPAHQHAHYCPAAPPHCCYHPSVLSPHLYPAGCPTPPLPKPCLHYHCPLTATLLLICCHPVSHSCPMSCCCPVSCCCWSSYPSPMQPCPLTCMPASPATLPPCCSSHPFLQLLPSANPAPHSRAFVIFYPCSRAAAIP